MKDSLRASSQQQTAQSAKVDAMGYRLEEFKKVLLQRMDLRMEGQMADLNTQMIALSAAARGERQKPEVTMTDAKVMPSRNAGLSPMSKASAETVTNSPKKPEATKRPAQEQVCAPCTSTAALVPSQTTLLTRTQHRAVDPITKDSSTLDLTDAKSTAGSHASIVNGNSFATAQAQVTEVSSILAADEGVPASNTCANVTVHAKKTNWWGHIGSGHQRKQRKLACGQ